MAPAALDVQGLIAGIDARLAELEPFIEEHAQLTAARAVLTGDGTAPARPAGRAATRSGRPARRAVGRRAPRGANRAAILAHVAEHPGATVAQISDATGIPRPTLYTTVSGLKKKGELIATGRGVKVPQAGTPARPRGARRARSRGRATRRAPARSRAARGPAATLRAPEISDAAARAGTTDVGVEPSSRARGE